VKRALLRLGLLAAGVTAGCLGPPVVDDYAESWSRPIDRELHAEPQEWFGLRGRATIRDPEAPDGVEDSVGVDFVGGWDLVGRRLRLSLEGQVGWSRHDTNWTPAFDRSSDDLDLLLVGLGLRLWLLPSAGRRFSPYVRAGGFGLYSLDDVDDEFVAGVPADYDESVYGGYVGGGLEVRYAPGCYFGPFYTYYHSEDGQLVQHAIGLGTRFRF